MAFMTLEQEIRSLVDGYYVWLKDNTNIKGIKGAVVIETPHLDRHNDFLEIVVSRSSDGSSYLISDDGWIISDLEASGCMLNTPKRKQLLTEVLNGFGVRTEDGEIKALASDKNFSQQKHNVIQAMLAVNDLFYTAAPHVKSFFLEDVENWLNEREIRFTPKPKFTGKSGYDCQFDFVIPGSRRHPERMLRSINNPNKSNALNFISIWEDIKETRKIGAQAYAFLNDGAGSIPEDVAIALSNYKIKPIPWSGREQVLEELAA